MGHSFTFVFVIIAIVVAWNIVKTQLKRGAAAAAATPRTRTAGADDRDDEIASLVAAVPALVRGASSEDFKRQIREAMERQAPSVAAAVAAAIATANAAPVAERPGPVRKKQPRAPKIGRHQSGGSFAEIPFLEPLPALHRLPKLRVLPEKPPLETMAVQSARSDVWRS